MRRIITIVVVIVLTIATIIGLGIAVSRSVGDMFWDYNERTWA